MPNNYKSKKNIIITGGSSGIGQAVLLEYAHRGIDKTAYICGRNETRLQESKENLQKTQTECNAQVIDVSNSDTTRTWLKQCFEQHEIDVVIVNAGISGGTGTKADKISDFYQAEQNIIDINVQGALNTLYPALEYFEKQGHGHIVVVGSQAGYFPMPSAPAYASSKGFVMQYLLSLAPILKTKNIQASVIVPGFVESRITDQNNFPMPFFMSADKAARIIVDGLEKKRLIISFPWPMHFLMSFLQLLPNALIRNIFDQLPQKP